MWKASTFCVLALLLSACGASAKAERQSSTEQVMEANARPVWNQESASELVGKRVLIGLTRMRSGESDLEQMFGRVRSASAEDGFEVELEGTRAGETYWLPPQLDAFDPAEPGEYRLRNSGEVVINPDFVATWVVEAPPE
jgi:hypothetical protein